MESRPGFAAGPASGLFGADHDDVAHQFFAPEDPDFAVFGDSNDLIRAQQMRESFLERQSSNDPRYFICVCAEERPADSLAVHALSENQD